MRVIMRASKRIALVSLPEISKKRRSVVLESREFTSDLVSFRGVSHRRKSRESAKRQVAVVVVGAPALAALVASPSRREFNTGHRRTRVSVVRYRRITTVMNDDDDDDDDDDNAGILAASL